MLRSLRLSLIFAALWLVVGYLHLARGTAVEAEAYRPWAFEHHAYSDVIALYGDRYAEGARPLPYLEDRIEYPVLLGLSLWLPSFAAGGAAGHFAVSYALLAAALVLAVLAVSRIPGASPGWLAATPALAVYAGLNWDLLAIALLAVALALHVRGASAGTGTALALGISTKLFPGVLVLPALAAYDRCARLRFAVALAGCLLLVNLPFAVAAFDGWSWFFEFNAGRKAQNSLWHALAIPRGGPTSLLNLGPVLAATAYAWVRCRRLERSGGDALGAARIGAMLALVVWIATNKIWSPQYALYGFLAGAVVSAPAAWFAVLSLVSLADYWVAFEVLARGSTPEAVNGLLHPDAIVRSVAWLAFAGHLARRLSAAR